MINNLVIPLMILVVVIYGLKQKINIYESFISGAKESFGMIIDMFPFLLGMILGINIFTSSNFLNCFLSIFEPFFKMINVPVDIMPLGIMRSISGTTSLALLNNIFEVSGPDSFIGRLGSLIQGSSDTTLYVITLYFGSIGIRKTRYAVFAGLMADLFAVITSIIICNMIYA